MAEHMTTGKPPCVVCGSLEKAPNLWRYCSKACAAAAARARRRGETRPAVCIVCGDRLPVGRVNGRAVKRSDTLRCVDCLAQRNKHGVSAKVLARRDGTDCKLCGEPVDMSLRKPDLRSPSIDRIIPAARGGGNEPENLQLAHLGCNHRKSLLLEEEVPFNRCARPGCKRKLANRAMGLCSQHMRPYYRNGTVPPEMQGRLAFARLGA